MNRGALPACACGSHQLGAAEDEHRASSIIALLRSSMQLAASWLALQHWGHEHACMHLREQLDKQ